MQDFHLNFNVIKKCRNFDAIQKSTDLAELGRAGCDQWYVDQQARPKPEPSNETLARVVSEIFWWLSSPCIDFGSNRCRSKMSCCNINGRLSSLNLVRIDLVANFLLLG
jgi:hypothetical protein